MQLNNPPIQPEIDDVQARNQWFASLTPRQQRIQIVHDALQQTKELNRNVQVKLRAGFVSFNEPAYNQTINQSFLMTQPLCKVCAIGALMVARIQGYDDYSMSLKWGVGRESVYEALQGIFSKLQLALIETAYEGYEISHNWEDIEYGEEVAQAAIKLTQSCRTGQGRFRKIMRNILDHNGDFILQGFTAQRCGVQD